MTSVSAAPPTRVERAPARPARSGVGALPWVVFAIAAGVMAASAADALSRTGHGGGSALFWIALTLIMLPAALRLTAAGASSAERATIVVAVGLGLYAVKVLRDPFAFTYGDELAHLPNLQAILASGHLFGFNSLLPITPRYPGLELTAALIVRAGGVSPFGAGLILIGAGRILWLLALYLLYVRVSGSARAAGLGAIVYAATPNFLFWDSQFAYESLALPMAVAALLVLMQWGHARNARARRSWEIVFALIVAGVVVTHHVSSYFLVVFVLLVCMLHVLMRGRGAPWVPAATVTMLTVAWLVLVAGQTVGYLSPVLTTAIDNVAATLSRETGTRALFANQGAGEVTPLPERIVALGGIVLLGVGVLIGAAAVRRQRWRRRPVLTLLALCAIAYLGTLPLRLVPAAWETASRLGEYLFIGVGIVVALGVVGLMERNERPLRRVLVACSVMIVFASGVIAGWPASQQLADPRVVLADTHALQPPSVVAAQWSGRVLGPSQVVFAPDADARLFVVNGRQVAYTGNFSPDVDDLLASTTLTRYGAELREYRVTLVDSDRRTISSDNLFGFFWDIGPPALMAPQTTEKFDVPRSNLLFDGGNIVIFGVRGLW